MSDDAQSTTSPRRFRRPWVLIVISVIGLAAAGYASTLRLGGPGGTTGAASSGKAVTGIGLGQAAPDFVSTDGSQRPLLEDLDGQPIRLSDFAGKPVWIVFWATWCTPCQEEASDIRAAFHEHRDQGLSVLAIDLQEPASAVRDYVQGHDLDYAIGLDPKADVMALYGGWGLPAHFFLDDAGVIRARYLGQLTRDLMEQQLRSILPS